MNIYIRLTPRRAVLITRMGQWYIKRTIGIDYKNVDHAMTCCYRNLIIIANIYKLVSLMLILHNYLVVSLLLLF